MYHFELNTQSHKRRENTREVRMGFVKKISEKRLQKALKMGAVVLSIRGVIRNQQT